MKGNNSSFEELNELFIGNLDVIKELTKKHINDIVVRTQKISCSKCVHTLARTSECRNRENG